jgi:flagellar biosynthesis protein FlhG
MNRTITITSGKVGIGKTNICLNLALLLSKLGYRICVFDADIGLPNINTFLGLQPVYNLKDAILDGLNLKDLIIKDYEGIDIFPGSSGVEDMTNIEVDRMRLIRSFSETAHHDFLLHYDFLLVDMPAGVSKTVVSFCLASSEIIVVLDPEHTSLTKAYTLLKTLSSNGYKGIVWVVVNQCPTSHIAKLVYKRFKSIVAKNLKIDVLPLGLIYQDSKMIQAVKQQKIFVSLYPKTNASKCLQKIAERLVAKSRNHLQGFDVVKFWRGCIELISGPLNIKEHVSENAEFPKITQEPQAIAEQSPQKDVPVSPLDSLSLSETILKETNAKDTITAQKNDEEMPDTRPSESGKSGGWYRHKDAAKHWYRAPVVEPGSEEETADLEENSLPVIERLIKNISSISEELQLIRKALEGNGKIMLRVGISGEPDSKKSVKKNNHS